MKRYIALLLAVLICVTSGLPVFAEEEVEIAGDLGDTGLTATEEALELPEETEEIVLLDADELCFYQYIRLTQDCPLYKAADFNSDGIASLTSGTVALMVASEVSFVKIAFYSERGTVEGYIPEEYYEFPEAEEVIIDENNPSYDDEGNFVLPTVNCEFIDPEGEDEGEDEPEAEDPEENPEEDPEEEEPELPELNFTVEEELILSIGESYTIVPQVLDEVETAPVFVFTTDSVNIADVDANGKITAKAEGTARIMCAAEGYSSAVVCTVHVRPIAVEAVQYPKTLSMGIGESVKPEAVYRPDYAQPKSVTYVSDKTSVATVSSTGKITAKKAGTANITLTTDNGLTATCAVTVAKAPTKVTLSATSGKMLVGSTFKVSATLPKGTASSIKWESSNTSVVTVQDGVLTAVAVGSAKITATTFNGKSASCSITVKPVPNRMELSTTDLTMAVGTDETLTVTYYADDELTLGTCTFTSSDTDIAEVSASGEITAKATGETIITVNALNGLLLGEVKVTVRPAPTAVSFSVNKIIIGKSETYQLQVQLEPANAYSKLTFKSANSARVSVSANGLIKGKAVTGKTITKIRVQTENGLTAYANVKVYYAPTKVSLSQTSASMLIGETLALTASVPSTCMSQTYAWTSSDESVATVENGVITAVAPGTATIRATAYNGKYKKCTVTVYPLPDTMTLVKYDFCMSKGATRTLTPVFTAEGVETIGRVTYTTSDSNVVKVSSAGKLTAVGYGTATITVMSDSCPTQRLMAQVEITVQKACKGVALNYSKGVLGVGETFNLTATCKPTGCCEELTWKSSNTNVCTVDENGLLTAVKKGSCTIYVKSDNGYSAKCAITVKKAPTSIKLSKSGAILAVGGSVTLSRTLSSGSSSIVKWTSEDTSVAKVTSSGKVLGMSVGSTVVTATTYNGLTASCQISVIIPKTNVSSTNSVPSALRSSQSSYSSDMSNEQKIEALIYLAQSKMGKTYSYGSVGPNAFDCSGYVYYCFGKVGVSLDHNAHQQSNDSRFTKVSMLNLQRGDIVFFDNDWNGTRDHSGIYLGAGWFAHASSSAGKVICSYLYSGYYYQHFCFGRRVFN